MTIILSARNEAMHITATLRALLLQKHVLLSILVVDDHSDDDTAHLVRTMDDRRIQLLSGHGSGKRSALAVGIDRASEGVILLTDADCIPAPDWAWTMCRTLEQPGVHWVSGPIAILDAGDIRTRYDALESHGLMLLTGAAFVGGNPEMAQGASIAFRKSDFLAVGGYEDWPGYASGDDVFLLERFRWRYPGGCRFLYQPQALVNTSPVEGWWAMFSQRRRWASKYRGLSNRIARSKMMLVFAVSVWWLVGWAVWPFWSGKALAVLLLLLIVKMLADAMLLWEALRFTGRTNLMRIYLPAAVIHPLLVVYAGVMSTLAVPFNWKGRRVK